MKKFKKLLSVIICFCMIFAGITFADHTEVSATPNSYLRLGGDNRYLTSIKISQDGWPHSDYVVIASGENYPDALCAAPLAKLYDAPILLTPYGSLAGIDANNSLEKEIERLHPSHAFIIGGAKGAVSYKVKSDLQSLGVSVIERLDGDDRYETSFKVAQKIEDTLKNNNSSITGVAVASGENYPDALSIASIAAAKNMPILLTKADSMNSSVNSFIQTYNKNNTTYVIGGDGVIIDKLCNTLPNHKRLGGIDRYHTNIKVINEFTTNSDTSLKNLYVAYSYGFADALSGSAEAAKDNGVILLAYYNDITGHMKDSLTYIHSNLLNINTVKVLGGIGVVSDKMANKVISPGTVLGFTDAGGDAYDTMAANYSTIDEIGICKYSAESDGVIYCSTPAPNTTSYAISKEIKPLAVVSDGWNSIVHTLLSNLNYRQNFITNLLDAMGKNSCSGVNIDFESMKAVDRDNFSTFIYELSSALHKSNYLLTVTVVAKTSDNPTNDWEGPFDYYQIGKYADQVDIMTYWENDTPTSQYPINRVQADMEYALTVIPRNKILLGLGAYAADWLEYKDSNGNLAYSKTEFSIAKAYSLANQYNNGKFQLDTTTECEHFDYTDSNGGKHHVWFDDGTSVAYKLKLVNDNDLGGVAIWQLAYPDSGYMDQIKSMLQK